MKRKDKLILSMLIFVVLIAVAYVFWVKPALTPTFSDGPGTPLNVPSEKL